MKCGKKRPQNKEDTMDDVTGNITRINFWPNNIFAVTLFEEDLPSAKKFYQEAFGLDAVFEDPNSCVFKIGSTLINLLKTTAAEGLINPGVVANPEEGARLVFTIHVDDVDALCEVLTEHGVKLLNGPVDRPWGVRTASFMDPGGHIW
jgi:predicted enzyme related to lactoylglutathione lyase